MSIAVFGLGRAGLPLAAVIADSGLKVIGVDLDLERCEEINKGVNPIPEEPELDNLIKKYGGKKLVATADYKHATECNFFIIIVPVFIDDDHNPDFKFLKDASKSIGKILNKEDCVVLETTVPPKTTETLVKKWLDDESGLSFGDFYLAYSPERIMTGHSISRLKEFPKVIGGVDKVSGEQAFSVYKKFIPNLSLVSSARVAEFIKVIEGCYRSTNIALANELFKIADELDVDFFEAREYANHRYCDIHLPSTGVGGHCIPVYPWFLIKELDNRGMYNCSALLKTSQKINDEMVDYWAEKIVLECMKIEKPLNEVKICVKGITFREGVKSLYNSRNLALTKLLDEKGLDVYVYDELFTQDEFKQLNLAFARPDDVDIVFDAFRLEIIK
jgi:UDP-N-acetyl-D-mannosaminuronic acid dehydrogenase